jgi:hypothetical protein
MTSLIARIFLKGFTLVFRTLHIPDHGYPDENPDDPDCISFLRINFYGLASDVYKVGCIFLQN